MRRLERSLGFFVPKQRPLPLDCGAASSSPWIQVQSLLDLDHPT